MLIEAWFDGAAWPNPGHASCGAVVKEDGKIIYSHSEYTGDNLSNNCSEYHGLILVLEFFLTKGIQEAIIYGDSLLVVNQMLGKWKVGKPTKGGVFKPKLYLSFYKKAKELQKKLPNLNYQWIPREQNTEADALSTIPLVGLNLNTYNQHNSYTNKPRRVFKSDNQRLF